MANSIALDKIYVDGLDAKYRQGSFTAVLDGPANMARQGANANELVIKKIDMSGLKDYSRNSGYEKGDVTLTNETVKCNYDRGIQFNVDALDNQETADAAFGDLAGEFLDTQVTPELDAFRLATYASTASIGTASGDLKDGNAVIKAVRAAVNEMDENSVPYSERHIFITPTLYNMVLDLETYKSKSAFDGLIVHKVPQNRMYSKVKLQTGEESGYIKDAEGSAKNLNFIIIHKPAVIQYQKHVAPKVIAPEVNQFYDGWTYNYRTVGIADVYENKVAGIYAHLATA